MFASARRPSWSPKNILTVAPEAHVDMATAADFRGPGFGHEGDGFAVLSGDLLEALFEDDVHVRHGQRFVVAEVDLVLTTAPLALARFNGNAGINHEITDSSHERLVLGRLCRMIIDAIIARWREVPVFRCIGVVEAVVEQEELK